LSTSDKDIKRELAELLLEKEQRVKYSQVDTYFPETGPYRKDLYPKHIDFLNSSLDYPERAFIAANRVGKTVTGGLEMVYHLTGKYPSWWDGKRFKRPIKSWVGSITPIQMKEAVQSILFGSFADKGSGLLSKKDITDDDGTIRTWNMPGVPNVVGTVLVRHYTEDGKQDGWSQCEFKTYEQGWEKWQGAKIDVIWLDEEPKDHKIYSEAVTRTGGASGDTGIIYCTFTPLLGFSDTVLSFLPGGKVPRRGVHPDYPWKKVVNAGWDDVPHLDDEWKKQRLASYAPHEKDARAKGIPTKGSGAIYPVPEESITIRPFHIPEHWTKAFGMDFGWTNPTAVIWGARDPESKVIYLYSEHVLARTTPPLHAEAIKQRGEWIMGACDPAGGGSSQKDGSRLIDEYLRLGTNIMPSMGGPGSKEPRISKVLTLFESGQLKIFDTLSNCLDEYRVYRRDEDGKIVKKNDHLMDALQYLISEWEVIEDEKPDPDAQDTSDFDYIRSGQSSVTGY
jgi:phage terminase large subunit-like protein